MEDAAEMFPVTRITGSIPVYGSILNKLIMKEKLITFETAKLAKEKGCRLTAYTNMYNQDGNFDSPYKETYPSYSQSLLQRWLRENMNINVLVVNYYDKFSCVMKTTNDHHRDGYSIKSILTDTYEKALEAGLLEALKMIK